MPIYECHCLGCDLTFEVLAPLSRAGRRHPCPRCNRPAPRIASAFAIASGASAREPKTETGAAKMPAASKTPPLCLRHPNVPMLCHMEPKAAARWLARYNGRVAEYDDRQGAREDLRRKRGLPPEPPPLSIGPQPWPRARLSPPPGGRRGRAEAAIATHGAAIPPLIPARTRRRRRPRGTRHTHAHGSHTP